MTTRELDYFPIYDADFYYKHMYMVRFIVFKDINLNTKFLFGSIHFRKKYLIFTNFLRELLRNK